MTLLSSKYPFRCTACHKSGEVGERVSWVKGVQGVKHALCSEEGKEAAAKVAESRAVDAVGDFPAPTGKAYLPFQRAGIAYTLAHTHTLIADEMGLGKTVQAIGVINADEAIKTVLVVCPASLKGNWRSELDAWFGDGSSGFRWRKTKAGHIGDAHLSRAGLTVQVVNYDMLKHVEAFPYDLAVFDEFQYCKNGKAKRTQAAIRLAHAAKKVIGLTGTPINNRPKELYSQLLALKSDLAWAETPKGCDKKEVNFLFRYCGPQKVWTGRKTVTTFDGATNLDELQERLRSELMVRRLKADVLTELPAKVRQVIALDVVTGCEDHDIGEITEENYESVIAGLRKSGKVAFEDISAERHTQALAKIPQAVEFIREALDSDPLKKIIVFAHHHDVLDGLAEGLSEYGIARIDGRTATSTRQAVVKAFQEGPARVFVGSLTAASTGLTLTASSHVVFVELDWQPGTMAQAEDRAHRIGQRDSVLVQWLVVNGSLDSKIAKILVKKTGVISAALDTGLEYAGGIRDDIAWEQCTCLAAPDGSNGHASWCDYGVKPPSVAAVLKEVEELAKPKLSEEQIARIHEALRALAEACDGARSKDGQGFNRLDASFGTSLARRERLTEKQAIAAQRMLKKYKGQIGDV